MSTEDLRACQMNTAEAAEWIGATFQALRLCVQCPEDKKKHAANAKASADEAVGCMLRVYHIINEATGGAK